MSGGETVSGMTDAATPGVSSNQGVGVELSRLEKRRAACRGYLEEEVLQAANKRELKEYKGRISTALQTCAHNGDEVVDILLLSALEERAEVAKKKAKKAKRRAEKKELKRAKQKLPAQPLDAGDAATLAPSAAGGPSSKVMVSEEALHSSAASVPRPSSSSTTSSHAGAAAGSGSDGSGGGGTGAEPSEFRVGGGRQPINLDDDSEQHPKMPTSAAGSSSTSSVCDNGSGDSSISAAQSSSSGSSSMASDFQQGLLKSSERAPCQAYLPAADSVQIKGSPCRDGYHLAVKQRNCRDGESVLVLLADGRFHQIPILHVRHPCTHDDMVVCPDGLPRTLWFGEHEECEEWTVQQSQEALAAANNIGDWGGLHGWDTALMMSWQIQRAEAVGALAYLTCAPTQAAVAVAQQPTPPLAGTHTPTPAPL